MDTEEQNKLEVNSSSEFKNKVINLFTYLEKALALDDTINRDFRNTTIKTQQSMWWLSDYPDDIDSLMIRKFDSEKELSNIDNQNILLKVQKQEIEKCPELPNKIKDWVVDVDPLEIPKASESIDIKINFNDDKERVSGFKLFRRGFQKGDSVPEKLKDWVTIAPNKLPENIESIYVSDKWENHPELHSLLEGYVNNEWKPWSNKVNKIYKANQLYDQLYALRLLLKNEGDNYELLLGHGLFSWNHKSVGSIYSPIFFTPLVLDFDPSKRVIEISPDLMFKSFVEITPVSEMDNPAEIDLDKWMTSVNSNPFDFWHLESLKLQANTFLNYLSSDIENNFSDKISSQPTMTEKPSIWNAPVIFIRKRTNSLWSKYAETIKRDIEQNGIQSTDFIKDLVGEYSEDKDKINTDNNEDGSIYSINDSELFFPLPWNDEQKRIAERIESNYGVVVKGPPGTGKSHTIANLISRFLAQGKSVLVTSQTSKALDVLRGKLPENIQSLAVSQLQQTAKRDDVLQQSISEISSNLGERDTKFSESKSNSLRRELEDVRKEKASIANMIREYILIDSTKTIDLNGEKITPMNAAKVISKYENDHDINWFIDKINFDTELNFTDQDIKDLFQLLKDLNKEDRDLYKFELPDISVLPDESVVSGSFSLYKDLSVKSGISSSVFGDDDSLDKDELLNLWDRLNIAHKTLSTINHEYEKEVFNDCVTSQNEREKWSTVLMRICEKVEIIGKCRNRIVGHDIKLNEVLNTNDLSDSIKVLKLKVADGSKLGTFGKMILPSGSKKILDNYLVDGRSADTKERIDILDDFITIKINEKEIKLLLEQVFERNKNKPEIINEDLDIIRLEVFSNALNRIVNYYNDFLDLNDYFQKTKQFSDLSFVNIEDIEKVKEIISSSVSKIELYNLDLKFKEWINLINDFNGQKHNVVDKFLTAIDKKNISYWKKAVEELVVLVENKKYSIRINLISEKINKHAPRLYQDILGLIDTEQSLELPDNLDLVWKLARLKSWLDCTHDHVSIDDLQNKHERLSQKEFNLNSELVSVLSWQRQIDKVTKPQRDALMAWSDSMKKYGKGTGKYAHKHLSAAQESLREAKNAVPVWIMPLHRVAQMFSDPKAGMFDVVIFDEASQCDIRGLTVGYLGKKLLIVGDPDQISPAGIFQDQERVYELISRFLHNIPHKDNFSITSSLFDLAKMRISNMIQLNEHFRCVPEIIAFSNHHVYEGKLKPLRHPHPKGLLKPALLPVMVDGGYQNTNNKVNEPEARAIVEKIVECLDNPDYQLRPNGRLCSFGIISLLAEDQAKYIKDLLLKHPRIGEKVIEERNIVCGDAYAFQGDERDVMFLSMVKALDVNNFNDTVRAITDKGTAQRFNVAATRARDQVFLYHSIPLSEFRNPDDWRYKILNWYYNPRLEELDSGRQALKKEFDSGRASQFSYDVGIALIDRGYQVLPEYPVIGYRIDLVVQGENARLAVECDGDQYHTLENWEQDQIREMQLRRAGWEFWRISGSSYYRYKEKALDSLWKKLDELGIHPILGKTQ